MVNSFWMSVLISGLTSFLSGLGAGGGSLLMLWMTVILNTAQDQARIINLMYFIPCALIACLLRRKQGHLPLRKLIPAILSGIIFAYPASILSARIHGNFIKKVFGLLLIVTGIRELLYKPKAGH